MRLFIRKTLIIAMLSAAMTPPLRGENANLTTLREQAAKLFEEKRYPEALTIQKQRAEETERAEANGGKLGTMTAGALGNVAWYALFAGRPEIALAASERALTISSGELWIETNRAHALMFLGRSNEALQLYTGHKGESIPDQGRWETVILEDFAEFRRRGLKDPGFVNVEKALENAPESPEVLKETAARLISEQKFQEALPLLEKYTAIVANRYGEDHPKAQNVYPILVVCYTRLSRLSEAEALTQKVLAFREKMSGPESPEFADALAGMGSLLAIRKEYERAEGYLKRALSILEKTRGIEDPSLDETLEMLSSLYVLCPTLPQADSTVQRWIALREKKYGSSHPAVAKALEMHGMVYFAAGRYQDALPPFERSLSINERQLGPEHTGTLASLDALGRLYQKLGRYGEAENLAKRILDAREHSVGPHHPDFAEALAFLGAIRDDQGRFQEAEDFIKRALAIREAAFGGHSSEAARSLDDLGLLYEHLGDSKGARPIYERVVAIRTERAGNDDPSVAAALRHLGGCDLSLGHYAEAQAVFQRALAIDEQQLGAGHPRTGADLSNLAVSLTRQGNYEAAEPLLKRAVTVLEKANGESDTNYMNVLDALGVLYATVGRYGEAEALMSKARLIREQVFGAIHMDVALSLHNLSTLYQQQGRFREAELLLKRTLTIEEQIVGLEHPRFAETLSVLGVLYGDAGRKREAEAVLQRSLTITEKVYGQDHINNAGALHNLASVSDREKAEPLFKRAMAIREHTLGSDHPEVGETLSSLGELYSSQKRFAEAESILLRAKAIEENAFGPKNIKVAFVLNNLAMVYEGQKRHDQAEPLFERALAIFAETLAPDDVTVAQVLSNMAQHAMEGEDWQRVVELERKASSIIVKHAGRGRSDFGKALTGSHLTDAEKNRSAFRALVKAGYRLAGKKDTKHGKLAQEMFVTAQWALSSSAGEAVSQMTARAAKGNKSLSDAIRERQDLVLEWRQRDRLRISALARSREERNADSEAANAARLLEIDARIAGIDQSLAEQFPEYSTLAKPLPASIKEIQQQLSPDEAFIFLFGTPKLGATPEETFIWAITREGYDWTSTDFEGRSLIEEVKALRCGLDFTRAWKENKCEKLLGVNYTEDDDDLNRTGGDRPLPFDLSRAFRLYRSAFGKIQDLAGSKTHWLVVANGPWGELPLQVLVTKEPSGIPSIPTKNEEFGKAAWLGKQKSITNLPSIASLKQLRRTLKSGKAPQPYIAFANPLLSGIYGRDRRAWEKQDCPKIYAGKKFAAAATVSTKARGNLQHGSLANVEDIRHGGPLPETTDEVCAVANALGADPNSSVYLGARATERMVTELSANGTLAKARVVHFATHGLLAEETKFYKAGDPEPALVLTPPDEASDQDDGLLSASEAATLKLNADWVILSACNTAGSGGSASTGALSGLAQAFFYAGAHALLVSQWYVDSATAVSLITNAFVTIGHNRKAGRAEAMRKAISNVIAQGGRSAQPANWGPFILVGEGGAGR